jgi:hypothetical protein
VSDAKTSGHWAEKSLLPILQRYRDHRVYDEAGNVIETHESASDFREHRNDQPLPNSAHAKANVHTNAAKVGVASALT